MQAVRVVSKITWNEAAALQHSDVVSDEATVAFQEVRDGLNDDDGAVSGVESDDSGSEGECAGQLRRRRYAVSDKPMVVCFRCKTSKGCCNDTQTCLPLFSCASCLLVLHAARVGPTAT